MMKRIIVRQYLDLRLKKVFEYDIISQICFYFPFLSQSKTVYLNLICMRIAVRMSPAEIIRMMKVGEVIASSSPILYANSVDVSLRRRRLPMAVPKGCAIDWIMLAFSADLVYLMERLSKEISCIVRNS
jgi:hypothetical protein